MVDALDITRVMPSEVLLALHKYSHGLSPAGMHQGRQPALQRVLNIWKIVSTFKSITFIAWRIRDQAQLRASLARGRWQVIAAFWHLAWCAQSSGDFVCFFL